MKTLLALLLLSPLCSLAQSFSVGIDPRVKAELRKFSDGGNALPDSYVEALPRTILSKMTAEKRSHLSRVNSGAGCAPTTSVTFLKAGDLLGSRGQGAADADAIDEFESGMIRIEALGCMRGEHASEALDLVNQPAFQLSVVSELKSSQILGGLTCDRTSVTGLGSSEYCYTSLSRKTPGLAWTFTQNVTNAPVSQASAPVYFRSIFMTFTEKNGVTYGHTIAYVRGPKIPGILRGVGRSRISSTQARSFVELERRLK